MENTVTLGEDNILHVLYLGDQNYNTVTNIAQEIENSITILRERNLPVHILVDLTQLGKTRSEARKAGMNVIKTLDCDKAALFGKDVYTKYLVNFIVQAAGKMDRVKYFSSQEEANAWLRT